MSSENYTQLKFKPGTVEKNMSTIGPPAGIGPTPMRRRTMLLPLSSWGSLQERAWLKCIIQHNTRLVSYLCSSEIRALQRHRKSV